MAMANPPPDTAPSLGDPLLDAVLDAAASLIVVGDNEGRLLCWNRACERLSGYSAEEIGRSPGILDRVVVEEDRERAESVVDSLARGESPVLIETRWRTRGGDVRLISWSCTGVTAPDGTITHVVATGIDVTERRRLERRLRHLADHDDLTGLINRRRFQEELQRHLAEGRRYGLRGALLVLDLDGFKEVNDTHGHSAGDRVLCAVADALRSRLRESDIVAPRRGLDARGGAYRGEHRLRAVRGGRGVGRRRPGGGGRLDVRGQARAPAPPGPRRRVRLTLRRFRVCASPSTWPTRASPRGARPSG
jgi:PAS domain S-box-containing protein